jgi:cyclopropane fatty-acyl-phospholipid synthase-like methyltransferase
MTEVNETLAYYENNCRAFAENTGTLDFSSIQDQFLALLPEGGTVLDFGCGSGRDSRYFIDHGCTVTATDGCGEMCRYASASLGIPVKKLLFTELNDENQYDGIWACASILHLEQSALHDVFEKMITALKSRGIIYTSFKYGDFHGIRNGRYFTDFTETSIADFLKIHKDLRTEQMWITEDIRPDHGQEKWLNLLLQLTY